MAIDPLVITDSDINGILKRVYSRFREIVFPILVPLLANIERGKGGGPFNLRWGGEGVRFDVVLDRPVGMVASRSGYLPKGAAATEKQGEINVERMYVRRAIDGLFIRGTTGKEAAYTTIARKVLQEMKDAARLGMQEMLHGDQRAIKGLITTVNSTTSIDVQSPYGIAGSGEGGLLLAKGMFVAVLDSSSADAVLGRATITAVANSGDTATLTLDTAIASMDVADKVVSCTESDTSYNSYTNGLTNILNRGGSAYQSLHGISAGTYARWDATRLVAGTSTTSTADNPNEMDVWRLIAKVAGVSGEDARMKPNEFLLLTTPGIEEKLANSFLGQRRFDAANNVELKGGFKAIRICGLPLISDNWCPAGTLYLIHLPSLFYIDGEDWGAVQFEGAGPWRWIDGRDAFETSWKAYLNFGTGKRNAHGMITGYTDTFRYSHVQ